MTKRHIMRIGDWESVISRMQELVLANSGEDDFEEIFKLLIAKLFSEKFGQSEYQFCVKDSSSETAKNVNALLAKANEFWKGIFQNETISKLTDEHLLVCVKALQDYSILDTSLEVLDSAFEFLVSKAYKGSKGQYFTPRHVVDCCIQILDPSPDESVIDPACGSAGFLIHTLNYIQKHYPDTEIETYCKNHLWGFDFDRRSIQIAKALMLVAGDGHSNLFHLNSILPPKTRSQGSIINDSDESIPQIKIEDVMRSQTRKFKGFDVVVTNPPFAGEIREIHILENYNLYTQAGKRKRIERDVLFLERCVNLLKPGGRLCIILPNNKLSANSCTYLREWLMKQVKIVAVLGLGRHTFLPHTHQKTGVIFAIKREKPIQNLIEDRNNILFLISEKEGKDSKGQIISRQGTSLDDPAWVRADHDLDEIVSTFHNFTQSERIPWSKNLCLNTLS